MIISMQPRSPEVQKLDLPFDLIRHKHVQTGKALGIRLIQAQHCAATHSDLQKV